MQNLVKELAEARTVLNGYQEEYPDAVAGSSGAIAKARDSVVPKEKADHGWDSSASRGYQVPYYCTGCGVHLGDVGSVEEVPDSCDALCSKC